MNIKILKWSGLFLGVLLLGLSANFLLPVAISWASVNSSFSLTAADAIQAGYAGTKLITVTAIGRFPAPSFYFNTKDKVTSPLSETPNVVMVSVLPLSDAATKTLFNYGVDSHYFALAGISAQEATMLDGKVAINFIKGNNYVIVMGPDKKKIETFALAIAAKIQ